MRRNGIIFDLDGTLWEVIDSTYYSVNKIANKYGLNEITKETVCNVFGLNKVDSAKLFFPYLDIDKSVKLMDEMAIINIKNLKKNGGNIYPNLEKNLIILKEKFDLFIVSNTAEDDYINTFLVSSNLKKYFSDYIAASKLQITKSDAIKLIIEQNELKNAVYVGDTVKDEEASKNAGIKFIYAKYGFGKNVKAQYSINSINELPDVLEKLNFGNELEE